MKEMACRQCKDVQKKERQRERESERELKTIILMTGRIKLESIPKPRE
jgi:hypothetical protein